MTTATRRQGYYATCCEYWNFSEPLRVDGRLPEWAFDFISIHNNDRGEKPYSLLGPSKLVVNENRPSFERERYKTFTEAKKAAAKLARKLGFCVVNCTKVN